MTLKEFTLSTFFLVKSIPCILFSYVLKGLKELHQHQSFVAQLLVLHDKQYHTRRLRRYTIVSPFSLFVFFHILLVMQTNFITLSNSLQHEDPNKIH